MDPTKMKSDRQRLTFAPYDPAETKDEARQSAVAFDMLRAALKNSQGKPDAPEQPGSWERTATLHLFFSRGESKLDVPTGQFRMGKDAMEEIKVGILVLDPKGYTAVLPTETVALLKSIWGEWMKTSGTRAVALRIMLTNDWFAESISDAADESALTSGAITGG